MVITSLAVQGITDILNYWADIGVFSYVLPFLLIFAIVFGILSRINILGTAGKNKGVNAVIAIAVGLLALQWDIVPSFFSTIFPYAGVGLAVLLVALILFGLFGGDITNKDSIVNKILLYGGIIIAIVVVISSLTDIGRWSGGLWWDMFGPALISLAIIGALIGVVIGGGGGEKTSESASKSS